MGPCPADGVTMGHARKRGKRAMGGCEGRREQRQEHHLCNGRQGGDAGPPWGEKGARGKKGGQQGWEGAEPLGVGGKYGEAVHWVPLLG